MHDGDMLGVNGAEVSVLKDANQVGLSSLPEGKDGTSLETQVILKVLGDLTDKTLEWGFANEKVGGFLVMVDLTKSHGFWAVMVGLLDTTSGRDRLASSLCGKLLTRSLASSRLTSSLLGVGHGFAEAAIVIRLLLLLLLLISLSSSHCCCLGEAAVAFVMSMLRVWHYLGT